MTTDLQIQYASVTGATGFIGRWLLVELTRQGVSVGAFMREPARRERELRDWVAARGGDPSRLHAFAFDLDAADLGLCAEGAAWLARSEALYHLAARFEFGLSEEVAKRANVDASLRLIERVAGHASLKRFVHLSGYRTEGAPARALDVDDAATLRRFYATHGAYEASKMEAHQRVAARAAELGVPLTRVSPAVVIGHSESGETAQFIGLAETLRRLHARQLPALPGNAQTWLPLITVDYLAACLARVPSDDASLDQHLLLFDDASPSLPALVRRAAARMGVPAPRLQIPVGLVRALPSRLSGVDHEALSFLSTDRYDAQPASRFAQRVGLRAPAIDRAYDRWVDYLVYSGFGARPDVEPGAPGERVWLAGSEVFMSGDRARAEAVMLHGVMLNAETWADVRAALGTPTLAVDLPGLGRSASGGGTKGEWLRAVTTSLESKPVLVAHSLGAAYALELARDFPERIRGLVLVSPFFLQGRPSWPLRLPWVMAHAFRWLKRLGPALALGQAAASPRVDDAMTQLARPRVAKENARWLAWAAQARVRDALKETMDNLRVPVVLVHGEHDPLVVPTTKPYETHTIPDAGHYPQVTHPLAIARAVQQMQHAAAV